MGWVDKSTKELCGVIYMEYVSVSSGGLVNE